MAIRPLRMTKDQLVGVLQDITARVEIGDSFEGSLAWTIPDDDARGFDVTAMYRIGNLEGQGGMRMIGDTSLD